MDLPALMRAFGSLHAETVYVKALSPNDNSKNQIYLGSGWETVGLFPFGQIAATDTTFKASVDLHWISDSGETAVAPGAQLILYPKYPEVRLSGFIRGCTDCPRFLSKRDAGRYLFFARLRNGRMLAYAADNGSRVAMEFEAVAEKTPMFGLFFVLGATAQDNKSRMLSDLRRISSEGWLDSTRLNRGFLVPCKGTNCGGYTLEARLGISPNGFSEPDYLGWEVKQHGVGRLDRPRAATITLMTPEPTGGVYRDQGPSAFVRKWGYTDASRPNRTNFSSPHRVGQPNSRTALKLSIDGFDASTATVINPGGSIGLIDRSGAVAASWSFAHLMELWNRKHAQAVFVPSETRDQPHKQYRYGCKIGLGEGTNFPLLLSAIASNHVYYDPGIHMVMDDAGNTKVRRRSQFRVRTTNLHGLYDSFSSVDLRNP